MAISDWPLAERPRERLLAQGAGSLSDAELLAVVLRTGLRGKSAVELGRDLLARFKSVAGLFAADLRNVKGLGPAKRAQFEAAMELARRSLKDGLRATSALTSPARSVTPGKVSRLSATYAPPARAAFAERITSARP